MKAVCCILGLFLLNWLVPSEADRAKGRLVGATFSCEPSPTQDLLPGVVGPMTGTSPAWMVDGSTWPGESEPAKTLWVLRRTSDLVRISGRRLDAPGWARLRRGSDSPSNMLFVANPSKESVIPGGAPPTVMRSYVFLPSHVFYPNPGCWQFTVQIAQDEFRIVREFRVDGIVPLSLFASPPNWRRHPTAAVHDWGE